MKQDSNAESATPDQSADAPASAEALAAALEEVRATADENWSRYLRTAAELENVRKRAARDVEQAHKYALEKFAGDMLNVKDSLEMGIKSAEEAGDAEAHAEGGRLTLRMLEQTLERHGVTEVDPVGEAFDPQWHEAMSVVPTDTAEPDTVVTVVQKGYRIHDRLLRPARVLVAKPPA